MKISKFIVGFIFISILGNTTFANSIEKKEKKIMTENKMILSEMSKNRAWIFETSTNWTAGNIAYGPIEILTGAGTSVVGLFIGLGAGAAVPHFFMKKGSEILLPVTIPCGAIAGATCGLAFTPICVVEGLFDTFTGGFFANGYFSWVDTGGLKGVSMKTVQDEIIEQTSD